MNWLLFLKGIIEYTSSYNDIDVKIFEWVSLFGLFKIKSDVLSIKLNPSSYGSIKVKGILEIYNTHGAILVYNRNCFQIFL